MEESINEIQRLIEVVKKVECITEISCVPCGAFELRVQDAKNTLIEHAKALATALVRGLVDRATKDSRALETEYSEMFDRCNVTPSSEAELVKQRTFLRGLDMVLLKMYRRSKAATKSVEVRALVNLNLEEEEFSSLYKVKLWPNRITDAVEVQAQILEQQKTAMIEILERDVRKFEAHLDTLSEEADLCKELSDVTQLKHIVDRSDSLIGALEAAREKGIDLNKRLDAFGWDPNPFITLDATESVFTPFGALWTEFAEFRSSRNEWLNESFLQLDGVQVRDKVEKTWVNSYKMAKRFANDHPEVSKVAKILREETTSFKELVPVIEALGNKAMKTRHWSKLADETGCDIIPDEFLTLQGMLDVGIQDHWDKVDEVSVNATKQYGLETKLDALIEAWEPIDLYVKAYKESGTFIIGGTEEVFQLLDDQVVTVSIQKRRSEQM